MMAWNRSMHQRRIVDLSDGFAPIDVDYTDRRVYSKCSHYGKEVAGVNWHEFQVNHRGQLKYHANPKQLILEGLFNAIDAEELYPVAYQSGAKTDTFLARNCKSALDKLFAKGLKITLPTNAQLDLSVILNVSKPNAMQINPPVEIGRAVDQLMQNLQQQNGVSGILNLSNFGSHHRFKHIEVSLANVNTLQQVCHNVYNNSDLFNLVNGFILANNRISNLAPLKLFGDIDFSLLDLTDNQIKSHKRLCSDLNRFRAKELKLTNNPLIKSPSYPDCMKPLSRNFKLVDGVPIDKLHRTYTPLNYEIDLECDGVRIDCSNKRNLVKFEGSKDWHAFKIPDPTHEFIKEALFDCFFISVNQCLSEFYPCYYKFEDGYHTFLVRNCYDQIYHLVHECNMEMKIPQLESGQTEVNLERSIRYFIRMNVSQFKPSTQIDPNERIEKCLEKCFKPHDRKLNLYNFRRTPGFEKLVINLGSPKIANKILTMASRKFMNQCTELNLSNNKIMTLDCPRALRLMVHLKSINLSFNWIQNLDDIKSLEILPLKALTLRGNPLCRKYHMPSAYVKAVKDIFVGLTILDGVELSENLTHSTHKNFLCDVGAYELAEVFLKKFLLEYESAEARENLWYYYTDQSIFTMTCEIKGKEYLQRTRKYATHSSNLKRLTDFSRAINAYHVGSDEIISLFMQLPSVEHDFVSLQTDVMHFNNKSAIIYVTGVFKDESPTSSKDNEPCYLAFSRQFVLKVDATGLGLGKDARLWKITNEHLNITLPSTSQVRKAFKIYSAQHDPELKETSEDKINFELHQSLLFAEITGLRQPWCTKFLTCAFFNFDRALKDYLLEETNNQIPKNAYS